MMLRCVASAKSGQAGIFVRREPQGIALEPGTTTDYRACKRLASATVEARFSWTR